MSGIPPSVQKRRLALFLDGTCNEVSDNTNVWRLRALFSPVGSGGCEQRSRAGRPPNMVGRPAAAI